MLISDSRFTYPDDSYEDIGQKVWPILPNRGIGAVLAGDVQCAEEGLTRISHRISLLPRLDPKLISDVSREALRTVYDAHRTKRGDIRDVQILLGLTDSAGYAGIIRLESTDDFVPAYETDVQMIGNLAARARFQSALTEQEAAFFGGLGQSLEVHIRAWAGQLAQILYDAVIEPCAERTVGGGIQVVTLDRRGWHECRIGYVDLDTEDGWHEVSAFPSDMSQYVRDSRLPPLAWTARAASKAKARTRARG